MLATRVPPYSGKLLGLSHGKSSLKILKNTGFATQTSGNHNAEINKFLIYWNSQITKYGREGNVKEAESIFRSMPTKNIVTHTAMLTAYAQNGQLKKARQLFDDMPERSVPTWNAMITAYVRSKFGIDEGFRLFLEMTERNLVSYAAMIMGFMTCWRFYEAERVYSEIPAQFRDPACSNVLVNGYLKVGKLEKATQIFNQMEKKDVVSWSSMVDGYCKHGRIHDARGFFDLMPERNEVTWSIMINGYMKMENFEDGLDLFQGMRREGVVRLEPTILTTVFEACGRFGRCREGCQVHGLVLRLGFDIDVFLGNSVITMYSRFGCIDAARIVFDAMIWKDIVTWNSLIAGYVQAGSVEEAYELFKRAPEIDVVSWTTMITGYSDRGLTGKCLDLFRMMPEKDDVSWTALISAFVRNEEYEKATSWFFKMFQNVIRPNALTLSTVLSASAGLALLNQGFAQNGFGKEALRLFEQILNKGLKPTEITFLGVLSACTHVGLVEEGYNFFSSMTSSYHIEPGPNHYACMVDLLGRAGLLERAVNLINSMPFEPHSGVWGAVLSASRDHLHFGLAKLAAEKISQLEQKNAAPYVVLSYMYSFAGKKADEERMRKAKKLKGIRKSPGCSWITVKNDVNVFLSGDRSHGSFEEIQNILRTILDDMKQLYWMDNNNYQIC